MTKAKQHQCTPGCNVPGRGLAAHNRAALDCLNEEGEVVTWAPEFEDTGNARHPWSALIKQWAERGVTINGPDEYGIYTYAHADGTALQSFSLGPPAKPKSDVTAILPALANNGSPLFVGFKRTKIRELTADELVALFENELWYADLDRQGQPERLSGARCAVPLGEWIYVFDPLGCRPWRPHESAKRSKYPEHFLPMRAASVIVTDASCKTGTLYVEEEEIDVFA